MRGEQRSTVTDLACHASALGGMNAAKTRAGRRRRHVWRLVLLLLVAAVCMPALAQETCGSDPATSPNHSANYILGTAGGVAAAMNWTTGLV
ncbi:MAG TPA: hypothetical protein VFN09_04325 [Rhodanobacteraceae bacterium]|nr:hypothetical protein [Rhodanobacteraceae bacterium]